MYMVTPETSIAITACGLAIPFRLSFVASMVEPCAMAIATAYARARPEPHRSEDLKAVAGWWMSRHHPRYPRTCSTSSGGSAAAAVAAPSRAGVAACAGSRRRNHAEGHRESLAGKLQRVWHHGYLAREVPDGLADLLLPTGTGGLGAGTAVRSCPSAARTRSAWTPGRATARGDGDCQNGDREVTMKEPRNFHRCVLLDAGLATGRRLAAVARAAPPPCWSG